MMPSEQGEVRAIRALANAFRAAILTPDIVLGQPGSYGKCYLWRGGNPPSADRQIPRLERIRRITL